MHVQKPVVVAAPQTRFLHFGALGRVNPPGAAPLTLVLWQNAIARLATIGLGPQN